LIELPRNRYKPPHFQADQLSPFTKFVRAIPFSASLPVLGAAALGSIASQATALRNHELKLQNKHYLTFAEANPEEFMAGKNQKSVQKGKRPVAPPQRAGRQRGQTSYAVVPPVAGGVVHYNPRVPRLMTLRNGTLVSNTELVAAVNMAALGAFATATDALVPGIPGWLQQISDCYSKFRWIKLRIIYIPACPTITPGRVGMCATYDRLETAPTTMTQMTQTFKSVVFPPYAGYEGCQILNDVEHAAGAISVDIDCNRFDKPWYPVIANGALSALAANIQNQYVPASIRYGSDGNVAFTAGHLYWKYVIEFIEPISPATNE
jgi:hypothetical protein